jgi:hypothetical protein
MDLEVILFVVILVAVLILICMWVHANNSECDTETDSVEDSPSAVTPAPSRTTIPGAQRIDTTPMTDRQLWEQIEYNTRMSADVLHRMWAVGVIIMVLNILGVIAMVASQ